jgi:hypothetical protein
MAVASQNMQAVHMDIVDYCELYNRYDETGFYWCTGYFKFCDIRYYYRKKCHMESC